MGEKDFEHLIDTLTVALAPKESGFTMSMTTIVTIFIAIMSCIATITGFLVVGYYSNFSEIKSGKVVDEWTKSSVIQLQVDMKEVKASNQEQIKLLNEIRSDQERRAKRENVR